MSLHKAISCGVMGNEISKVIANTSEVSVGRSTVAAVSGAATGAVAGGTIAIGAAAIGVAAAPVTVPLAAASAAISLVASFFD